MNRQRLILFILVIILALSLVWSYFKWPRQKSVAVLKYAPGTRVTAEKKREPAVALPSLADSRTLRLDLLGREQPAFTGYRRNIFRPVFVDEIKEMKQKAAAVKPALPPVEKPKVVSAQPAEPVILMPESPQQELAHFTFLGFISKDSTKTIFLSKDGDKGKDREIIFVKRGDMFATRYEAIELTEQALTILVTDTGDEIVIPLVENQALKAEIKSPDGKNKTQPPTTKETL